MSGVLDVRALRVALVNAGLGRDPGLVSDCAIFAMARIRNGHSVGLSVYGAIQELRRGVPCVNQRDYLRWGGSSSGQGCGRYRLPNGSTVSYVVGSGVECEFSRELDPALALELLEVV
jgi:hypothetical protein